MPISRACQICHVSFTVRPEQVRRGTGKYCSIACANRAKILPVDDQPWPIIRLCQVCHVSFTAKPAAARRGDAKYCSYACYWQAKRQPGIMCTCLHCGQPFRFMPASQHDGKYCSLQCFNIDRGAQPPQERFCEFCGTLFLTDSTTIRRGHGLYCSRPCKILAGFSQAETRFWPLVARCQHPSPCPTCCWLWQGSKNGAGYGSFRFEGKRMLAHRISWAWANEKDLLQLDPSLLVRHLCHTPSCVNSAHLAIGTQDDNMRDSALAGRISRGEQHVHAKLTTRQVQDIRQLRAEGRTYAAIASLFQVSVGSISHICSRTNWKHVP